MKKEISKKWLWLVLAVLIALAAYLRLRLLYWGYINDQFLVPPGTDPLVHLSYIEKILSTGTIWDITTSYPQGLHIIAALFTKMFFLEPMTLVKFGMPLLIILPVIPLYLLGRELMGKVFAFWAVIVYLLANGSAIVAYGDGLYANLVGSYFFLPFILFFVVKILKNPREKKNYFYAVLLYVLLGFFHHMSFALTSIILLVIAVVTIISRWVSGRGILNRMTTKQKILAIIGLAMIIVCTWLLYRFYLGDVIIKAIANVQKLGYIRFPIEFSEYREMVGPLVWYIGLIGVFLIIVRSSLSPKLTRMATVLLSWFGVMFLASRVVYSFMPDRIARETALPLVFLSAYVISYLMQVTDRRWLKIMFAAAFGWMLVTNTTMLYSGPYSLPQGFALQIRFQKMDLINLKTLHRHLPTGVKVAITPASPYIPLFSPDQQFVIMPKTILNQSQFNDYLEKNNIEYIATMPITKGAIENVRFPEFIGYKYLNKVVRDYPGEEVYDNGNVILKKVILNDNIAADINSQTFKTPL